MKRMVLLGVVGAAIAVIWLLIRPKVASRVEEPVLMVEKEASSKVLPDSKEPTDGMREDVSPRYLRDYGNEAGSPSKDLALVFDVIDAFKYTIKVPDALPTSGNRDIVAALIGDNPYRIRFMDPEFPFLNEEGEIVDRWESPLYFHFVEASDVGIRSAGPDRQLWTADDVVEGEYSGALSP